MCKLPRALAMLATLAIPGLVHAATGTITTPQNTAVTDNAATRGAATAPGTNTTATTGTSTTATTGTGTTSTTDTGSANCVGTSGSTCTTATSRNATSSGTAASTPTTSSTGVPIAPLTAGTVSPNATTTGSPNATTAGSPNATTSASPNAASSAMLSPSNQTSGSVASGRLNAGSSSAIGATGTTPATPGTNSAAGTGLGAANGAGVIGGVGIGVGAASALPTDFGSAGGSAIGANGERLPTNAAMNSAGSVVQDTPAANTATPELDLATRTTAQRIRAKTARKQQLMHSITPRTNNDKSGEMPDDPIGATLASPR